MLGLDRLFPARFPPRIMTDWDHQENKYVDHIEGSFFLVRRRVFEDLSGFDERFFLYFEDLDFAYRVKQAGWKSYYLVESQAFHHGGGTTNQIVPRRLFYWMASRVQYIAKHFGRTAAWGILIASLTVEFWDRVAWNLVNLSGQHLIETFQAYGMYIKAIPLLIRGLYEKN
jgi:hypothetical protein